MACTPTWGRVRMTSNDRLIVYSRQVSGLDRKREWGNWTVDWSVDPIYIKGYIYTTYVPSI